MKKLHNMFKIITEGICHLLHPKMTLLITSISKGGKPNAMSCAWASPVSEDPAMILICIWKESHTAKLIKQTGQFAVNIPTKKMLKKIWICGKYSGKNIDKIKKAKLKIKKPGGTKVPLLDGCIGHIECSVKKIIPAGECCIFLGNVIRASADDKYYKTGLWKRPFEIPYHLGGNKMLYLSSR